MAATLRPLVRPKAPAPSKIKQPSATLSSIPVVANPARESLSSVVITFITAKESSSIANGRYRAGSVMLPPEFAGIGPGESRGAGGYQKVVRSLAHGGVT